MPETIKSAAVDLSGVTSASSTLMMRVPSLAASAAVSEAREGGVVGAVFAFDNYSFSFSAYFLT